MPVPTLILDFPHRQLLVQQPEGMRAPRYQEGLPRGAVHGLSKWPTFRAAIERAQIHSDLVDTHITEAQQRPGGVLEIYLGRFRVVGVKDPDREQALKTLKTWSWDQHTTFELADLVTGQEICKQHKIAVDLELPDSALWEWMQEQTFLLEQEARSRKFWLPLVTTGLFQQLFLDVWTANPHNPDIQRIMKRLMESLLQADLSHDYASLNPQRSYQQRTKLLTNLGH